MPETRGRLYILGLGGHGRSVADVAAAAGYTEIVLVDAAARPGETFAGFPTTTELPEASGLAVVPALGDNAARRRACIPVEGRLVTLVAACASVGLDAEIGPGSVVMKHAHVGPKAQIGMGVIVNTGAIVEHDCRIGDFAHVSVGATVAGGCSIGANAMIGAGATVRDGVTICDDVVVGAGATVVRDIDWPGTYVGTPARPIADRA